MSVITPMIHVLPFEAMVDERLQIRLCGFPPFQEVTVRSLTNNVLGLSCRAEAYAVFVTDESGNLNLDAASPKAGTYDAADAMGLLWSMGLTDVQFSRTTSNAALTYELRTATVQFTVELDDVVVAEAACVRHYYGADVKTVDITRPDLVGKFFYREGGNPAPAVIVLGGGEGGLASPMTFSALLASHGYPALALAYFDFEHLPRELQEIPLEYFGTAIEWLQAHAAVQGGQIAVFGRSKGAELALLLGATYPSIGAVIASSPSSVVCVGNTVLDANEQYSTVSSWSWAGRPLPHAKWSHEQCVAAHECLRNGQRIDHIHKEAFLKAASDIDAVAIPVEKTNGPILLISSDDDHWWPATLHCDRIVERLEQRGFPHRWVHLNYPNAGHVIRFPYLPTTQLRMNGGTPKDNHRASQDAWENVLDFLQRAFPQQPSPTA